MILGTVNVEFDQEFFKTLGQVGTEIYTLPRFYCGPYNINLLTQTVNIVLPSPWLSSVIEQAMSLLSTTEFKDYTDLRETVLCVGGRGNSGKPFTAKNYLDSGIRVHISLRNPGVIDTGSRKVEYHGRQVMVFNQKDFGSDWTHTYPSSMEQIVLVLCHKDMVNVPSWKLFQQHQEA